MHESQIDRRATNARDAARVRVRRATGFFLAASVAAVGSLAAYVAGAASGRKAPAVTRAVAHKAPVRKTTTRVPIPDYPPAPTLHESESQSQPTQAPSSPPAEAPVPTQAPPVVVSGGS